MRLILHIGTHKTASTSLQHFCALNRPVLKKQGFLYPRSPDSAYVFNGLASAISFGKEAKVSQFMKQAYRQAQAQNCHTVIISAESFYAMTAFFIDLQKHARTARDYWENERMLIKCAKECLKDYDDVSVVCYVRAQDGLASSLYNQFVKNVVGIDGSYDEFLTTIKPVFDYNRHLSLWEEVFGARAVKVRNFVPGKIDIVQDFCANFINMACYEQADRKEHRANERLSRDVLEVKRIYNREKVDRSLAFVRARCFREISDQFKDKPGYQVFAPLEKRRAFLSDFVSGNEALAIRHGAEALPVVSNMDMPTYPGLSATQEKEIIQCFCRKMGNPANRIELALRRVTRAVMTSVPGGEMLLKPVRAIHNQFRLRMAGW